MAKINGMNCSVNVLRTIELKRGREQSIGKEQVTNRIDDNHLFKCVARSNNTISEY